ncbi:hypothetical protein ACX80L_14300 [Arthrobacter sp. MDT1-48-3]
MSHHPDDGVVGRTAHAWCVRLLPMVARLTMMQEGKLDACVPAASTEGRNE